MRVITFVVGLSFADEGPLDRELVEAELRNAIEHVFDGADRDYRPAVQAIEVVPSAALAK